MSSIFVIHLYPLLLLVPDQVQGVRSIPVSHSTLTVAVPIHQDVSIARGVITEYYCSIVRYDDSRAIQDATFVTGLMGDSYCIDEDDLANAVGSDLYNFTFTNLGKQTRSLSVYSITIIVVVVVYHFCCCCLLFLLLFIVV